MKKAVCLCLIFWILAGCWILPVSAEPQQNADPSVTSGCKTLDAVAPVLGTGSLITNAEAVFLYEINTQTLMYSYNADHSMYPASLVKMLTALIAVEKGNLSDIVTVKEDVIATVPYDAVSADLQAGEMVSLDNLLYCMMVDSANDAAAVIADHICGSQGAFVEEMNRYAQEIGCTGTTFKNVHGIHDDEQVTTARDMAKILAVALKNEVFQSLLQTVYYTVPATNLSQERKLSSGNFLMNNQDSMQIYYDSRVTGGRTGVTDDGGRCLAVTATNGDLEYISIIMGAQSVYEEDGYTVRSFGGFNETTQLLDIGFHGYHTAQILFENQILKQYPVVDGNNSVSAGCKEAVSVVLPEGVTIEDLTFTYNDLNAQLTAPVAKDQALSGVTVWYKNNCIAHTEIYAMNAVMAQTSVVGQPDSTDSAGKWKTVLLVIVSILVLLSGVFFAVRIVKRLRITAARSRSRRYRRNRRRSR